MPLLRALRSIRRRHLVVPAAIAAIVLTASVPAWAGGSPTHGPGIAVIP